MAEACPHTAVRAGSRYYELGVRLAQTAYLHSCGQYDEDPDLAPAVLLFATRALSPLEDILVPSAGRDIEYARNLLFTVIQSVQDSSRAGAWTYAVCQMIESEIEATTSLVRGWVNRTSQQFSHWFELGQQIAKVEAVREGIEPAPQAPKEERELLVSSLGLLLDVRTPGYGSALGRLAPARPHWKDRQQLDSLLASLGISLEAIFFYGPDPDVEYREPTIELPPFWDFIECGIEQLRQGATGGAADVLETSGVSENEGAQRPCYRRDDWFESTGLHEKLGNTDIGKRWNALSDDERKLISPRCWHTIGTGSDACETVKKGRKKVRLAKSPKCDTE